jgi:hypothetical protein
MPLPADTPPAYRALQEEHWNSKLRHCGEHNHCPDCGRHIGAAKPHYAPILSGRFYFVALLICACGYQDAPLMTGTDLNRALQATTRHRTASKQNRQLVLA